MIKIDIQKKLLLSDGESTLAVNTTIEKGSITTLYGKSGAGKTTLLRILAGLITPEEGYLEVDGEIWLDTRNKINLSPQKRKIGYVFQDFSLFPNMTVWENLTYAVGNTKDISFLHHLLQMVSLENLANRKPQTLSGGQQQRVALIRALVRKPAILLLDEPLSALDVDMRHALREEILQLKQKLSPTTLLVSHDLGEIYRLSDQVLVLEQGKISKKGTPAQIFSENRFSSKIQLTGEVLRIIPNEVVYVVEVLTGSSILKIVVTQEEAANLKIGETVLVLTKAFNPIIQKLVQ